MQPQYEKWSSHLVLFKTEKLKSLYKIPFNTKKHFLKEYNLLYSSDFL